MATTRSAEDVTRELQAERAFDASREVVFRAMTEPKHLVRWWGPKGFTSTFAECDVRPGGRWRFTMNGPDGTQYPNECVFVELVAPERIVIQHESAPRFQLTVDLTEERGQTRLRWRQLFESEEVRDKVKGFAGKGNEENLERLAAVVATLRG